MVQVYNFLSSWQLFPEKGAYEKGDRPKSGIYKISAPEERKLLSISHNWVTLENQAFTADFDVIADGDINSFAVEEIAETAKVLFVDSIRFELFFYRNAEQVLHIIHEIMPNGYLKLTEHGLKDGVAYTNTELYHKQMSVLPYASSVAGAVIKANEEGIIKHKALTAMEEQTNMQLQQIRKQIELLALQAQEIQKRKELSMMIYEARLSFKPNIGQTYFLYERKDSTHMLSLIAPKEWGTNGPFKKFIAGVKLLADHTWMEL